MNEKPEDEYKGERANVRKVFELCRELDALRRDGDAIADAALKRNVEQTNAALKRNVEQTNAARDRLNDLLGAFRLSPVIQGPPHFTVWWMPRMGTDSVTITSLFKIPPANLVKVILDMLEAETLDRVRQCICGRWFFAESNKKRVCSDACRFRKFKQDNPDFNDRRADYMREYRKNPRVKALVKAIRRKANGK